MGELETCIVSRLILLVKISVIIFIKMKTMGKMSIIRMLINVVFIFLLCFS